MLANYLEKLIVRDLAALRREIEAYPDPALIWRSSPGIANTAGNLVLHLTGNLRFFIGATLGGIPYVRDREGEFSARDLPREDLAERIDRATEAVRKGVRGLTAEDLRGEYPVPLGQIRIETGLFLVHLASHLAYHLGQVDYHRRIITGDGKTINAQSIPELIEESAK